MQCASPSLKHQSLKHATDSKLHILLWRMLGQAMHGVSCIATIPSHCQATACVQPLVNCCCLFRLSTAAAVVEVPATAAAACVSGMLV